MHLGRTFRLHGCVDLLVDGAFASSACLLLVSMKKDSFVSNEDLSENVRRALSAAWHRNLIKFMLESLTF